jgi:hypothetical protein
VTENGLEQIGSIVTPFTDPLAALDWPFPQVFKGMDNTYLAARHYLYTVDSSWSLTQLTAWFSSATWWDFADFGTFVAFTNGSTRIIVDVASGTYHFATAAEFPACKCLCNLNGQLVIGNTANGNNFVEWSEIGYSYFTPGLSNVAGFAPLRSQGELWRLMPLRVVEENKERRLVIAYCSDGIFVLTPHKMPAITFGIDHATYFGITSQGAVGGDENQHLFIDEHGFLRRLTPKGIDRLGFQEFFEPMLGTDIQITYDSAEREWNICNGSVGYRLNDGGLTQIDQLVSGGVVTQGAFAGVSNAAAMTTVEFYTDSIDFGVRAGKTIEAVELSGIGLASAQVCVQWKKPDGTFQSAPWQPVNQELIAYPKTYGDTFRFGVRIVNASNVELDDEIRVRWKLSDKRAIRGMYGAAKAAAGSNQ